MLKATGWTAFFATLMLSAVLVMAPAAGGDAGWSPIPLRRVETSEKVVALTFDDGPHPIYTPAVLNILDYYKAKATFFLIGTLAEEFPGIVRDIRSKGHAIANHTYSHPADFKKLGRAEMLDEIRQCSDTLYGITGVRTQLFRPPKGFWNPIMAVAVENAGHRMILWSVSADHKDAPTPEMMSARVVNTIRPGTIVLIHDGYYVDRWKDVIATSYIIEGLQRKGYRFVTVPELLALNSSPKKVPLPVRKPSGPGVTPAHNGSIVPLPKGAASK